MSYDRLIKILLVILGAIFYGLFLSHKINLVTADLGRHLINGQIFWDKGKILTTNYYSYTQVGFEVFNHHWLAGAVFYKIWQAGGFVGLQLFFIILSVASFAIMFWIGVNSGNILLATLLVLPAISLLAERMEIRPEALTYFFVSCFFLILTKYQNSRWVWLLPLLQLFWVNSHIYFFLGPLLIVCFLLGKPSYKLLALLVICSLITLINPFGFRGVIEPLTIFNNYGYRLAENQPIRLIEKLIPNRNYLIFKLMFLTLWLSFGYVAVKLKKIPVTNLLIAVGISIAGWLALRNLALFGLLAGPIMVMNFSMAVKNNQNQSFLAVTLLAVAIAVFSLTNRFGLGLEPGNSKAMEFFKEQNLSGPIFNNYDIGSFLIFYLFPKEPVFVDNRPEAYPAEFFKQVYVPMQEKESVWQEQLKKYQFNAIIFSINDYTPWGQQFLISRVKDPEWAVVFADFRVIIFLRRNDQNQPIIDKFEVPQERFRISK